MTTLSVLYILCVLGLLASILVGSYRLIRRAVLRYQLRRLLEQHRRYAYREYGRGQR